MTIRSSEGSIIVILPKHKDQFVAYDPLVNVLSEFCHQRQCMNEVIDVIVSTTINVDSMYDGIDFEIGRAHV